MQAYIWWKSPRDGIFSLQVLLLRLHCSFPWKFLNEPFFYREKSSLEKTSDVWLSHLFAASHL